MKNKLLNHDVSQNRGNALLPPVAFLFHLSIVRPRPFASVKFECMFFCHCP